MKNRSTWMAVVVIVMFVLQWCAIAAFALSRPSVIRCRKLEVINSEGKAMAVLSVTGIPRAESVTLTLKNPILGDGITVASGGAGGYIEIKSNDRNHSVGVVSFDIEGAHIDVVEGDKCTSILPSGVIAPLP